MAAKKRTSKKAGRGGKKTARKKPAKKSASKKASKKASSRKGKNLFTINPGLPSQTKVWASVSRWKRRTPKAASSKTARLPSYTVINPGLRSQTKIPLLPSGETLALVKAVEHASTPRQGPYVGAPGGGHGKKAGKKGGKRKPKKGASKKAAKKSGKKAAKKSASSKKPHLSKAEFLAKMAAGRAAAKKSGKKKRSSKKKRAARKGRPAAGPFAQKVQAARAAKASKRTAKKSSGKSSKRAAAKKGSGKKHRASTAARKVSRRKGWPKVGAHKRTFGIPKFKAMNALGVPPNHPIAKAKRTMLRESAGQAISAKQVFDMAHAANMQAWICAGKVRTGCGGGSKMLRGSHQIGVFWIGRK